MNSDILIAVLLDKNDSSIFRNIEDQFMLQWGKEISIRNDEYSNKSNSICYFISDTNVEIKFELFDYPYERAYSLPKETIVDCTKDKLENIRKHKSHAIIKLSKCNTEVLNAVYFIAQFQITLFKNTGVFGTLNFPAQMYLGAERFKLFDKHTLLELSDLFSMFVSKQVVTHTRRKILRKIETFGIHTHGLNQFNIPDIQIKITDKGKIDYAISVLDSVAFYSIQGDVKLNVGDKIKYGENETYLVLKVPFEEIYDHYSNLGAIEIAMQT